MVYSLLSFPLNSFIIVIYDLYNLIVYVYLGQLFLFIFSVIILGACVLIRIQ